MYRGRSLSMYIYIYIYIYKDARDVVAEGAAVVEDLDPVVVLVSFIV